MKSTISFSPVWLKPDLADDPALECPPLRCDKCGKPIVGCNYSVVQRGRGPAEVFHAETCSPKDPFAGVRSTSIKIPAGVNKPGGEVIVTAEFYRAAIEVVDAWLVSGRAPGLHERAKDELERNWRSLANSVGRLALLSGRPKR